MSHVAAPLAACPGALHQNLESARGCIRRAERQRRYGKGISPMAQSVASIALHGGAGPDPSKNYDKHFWPRTIK